MSRPLSALVAFSLALAWAGLMQTRAATYPKPSIYPIAWQLDFDHSKPHRIVVQAPGDLTPVAYWYITYRVTNSTDREHLFLPLFQMLLDNGNVIRANRDLKPAVFDAIKARENNKYLTAPLDVDNELRIGEDQAVDSVAIWKEPQSPMGHFTIFVTGLSGETAEVMDDNGQPMKDKEGNPIILRKTLQLDYQVRGAGPNPAEDQIVSTGEQWIMR